MKMKHNRHSFRLPGHDYSSPGFYFITICTKNRIELFGNIINGDMVLNTGGQIALKYWKEIPKHFPQSKLHEWVIMPNHIHGIIEITQNPVGANHHSPGTDMEKTPHIPNINSESNNVKPIKMDDVGTVIVGSTEVKDVSSLRHGPDGNNPVGVNHHSPGHDPKNTHNPPRPNGTSNTIGSIIRGFKIGVTKWYRLNNKNMTVWQRNYWEHIIRNRKEFINCERYIRNNPQKWWLDRFYNNDEYEVKEDSTVYGDSRNKLFSNEYIGVTIIED